MIIALYRLFLPSKTQFGQKDIALPPKSSVNSKNLRLQLLTLRHCWQSFASQVQLRGNQKDFNFQLHHRLSKFEGPVVVNLKHIFELFGLYTTCFLIQKLLELIRLSSDGQFWRKTQNKKGRKFELRSQLCYYNCTSPFGILSLNLSTKLLFERRLLKRVIAQLHMIMKPMTLVSVSTVVIT